MKHKSQKIKVKIHSLGHCPEGIGQIIEGDNKDMTVFVNGTTVGDYVEAETYFHKKNYLKANVKELIEEGPSRVKAKCPFSKVCGGCQWQHIDYNVQLEAKTNAIKDNIERISGLSPDVVKEMIASPNIWNYRAKVQLPLGITKKSRRLLAGYYKAKSHEIVNIKYCPVQPELFDKIIAETRILFEKKKLEIYNEKTGKGYLRHLIIRQSFDSKDILLTFIVNAKRIKLELTYIAEDLMKRIPQIKGVTVNINTEKTNVIFGKESKTIAGYNHVIEKIGDKKYHISDKSFFQVNPAVAKLMFDYIRQTITENNHNGTLLDIYAGVCAISIYVSDLFKEITAIENEKSCKKDAKENFTINNVSNINYICENAKTALESNYELSDSDWIILDPPRAGCQKEVLEACVKTNCGNIIYTSCNPATMARDLKILTDNSYQLVSIQPFDMFCHSFHIEAVSYLKKNG